MIAHSLEGILSARAEEEETVSTSKRMGLSILAGVVTVVLVTVIRGASGADPVVSHGLGGPGFLGAVAAFITWSITRPSDEPNA